MSNINEFTEQEIKITSDTLAERYGKDIPVEMADTELRLDPSVPVMTTCPAIYRESDDCHFIVCKIGKMRFHSQFFYSDKEQYGTGIHKYDDLHKCLVSTLQVQADYQLTRDDVIK